MPEEERRRSYVQMADVLWGGPHGPGLVWTVAELASTVSKQADSSARQADAIADLTDAIRGERGLANDVRELQQLVAFCRKYGMPIVVAALCTGLGTWFVIGRSLNAAVNSLYPH